LSDRISVGLIPDQQASEVVKGGRRELPKRPCHLYARERGPVGPDIPHCANLSGAEGLSIRPHPRVNPDEHGIEDQIDAREPAAERAWPAQACSASWASSCAIALPKLANLCDQRAYRRRPVVLLELDGSDDVGLSAADVIAGCGQEPVSEKCM